ncbi:MAG: nitrous oxide reductase family maturation protein NosD [Thermoplasmatota archaeon]
MRDISKILISILVLSFLTLAAEPMMKVHGQMEERFFGPPARGLEPTRAINESLHVDGDNGLLLFAERQNWSGDGSEGDPIKVVEVDFNNTGIFMGNITLNIEFMRCDNISYFHLTDSGPVRLTESRIDKGSSGAVDGVKLVHCTGSVITDNVIEGYENGISLEGSAACTISGNELVDVADREIIVTNAVLGTTRTYDSMGNNFSANEMEGSGFWIEKDPEYSMTNAIANNNTVDGRKVYYFENADMDGLGVPQDAGQVISLGSENLVVSDLDLRGFPGVVLIGSTNVTIKANLLGSGPSRIDMQSSKECLVQGNTLDTGTSSGSFIRLLDSDDNLLRFNHVMGSLEDGVRMISSSGNHLTKNTIKTCQGSGISIEGESDDNKVVLNIVENNEGPAVSIIDGPAGNLIFRNRFRSNNGTTDTYSASRPQAFCGSPGNRWFLEGYEGNHWGDLVGPDEDEDGIVDGPYRIGGFTDELPLVEDPILTMGTEPQIMDAGVEPGYGEPGTSFTFYAVYRDSGGERAGSVDLVMGEDRLPMENFTGDPATGTNYSAVVELGEGVFTYHFEIDSIQGEFRFPGEEELTLTVEPEPIIEVLPQLSEGSVDPETGKSSTKFTFSVKYREENGVDPVMINVLVRGMRIGMSLSSGDSRNGSIYSCSTYLSPGDLEYHYEAVVDSEHKARFPAEGNLTLVVSSATGEPPEPKEEEPVTSVSVKGRKVGLFGGLFSSIFGGLVEVAKVTWEVGGDILEGAEQVVDFAVDGFHKTVLTITDTMGEVIKTVLIIPVFLGLEVATEVAAFFEITIGGVIEEVFKMEGLVYNVLKLGLNVVELLIDLTVEGSRLFVFDIPNTELIFDDVSDVLVSLDGVILSMASITETLANSSSGPLYTVIRKENSTQVIIYISEFSEHNLKIWVEKEDAVGDDDEEDGEISTLLLILILGTGALIVLAGIMVGIFIMIRSKRSREDKEMADAQPAILNEQQNPAEE